MKIKLLDSQEEGNAKYYLVKSSIKEYLDSLDDDYRDYDVQRSIVNNSYLDRMIDTVLEKKHIPIITLISNTETITDSISLNGFKILDGLQRTYRLKGIYDTANLFIDKISSEYEGLSDYKLKRKYKSELEEINSNGKILVDIKNYCEEQGTEELTKCFSDNSLWFEIWTNLTPENEVRKMLLLNAGHKAVNIKHQLELLFRNIIPILDKVIDNKIKVLREKDISAAKFSKERTVGSYHFSHIISALISFAEGVPVPTNTSFVSKLTSDNVKLNEILEHFDYNFMCEFIDCLYMLDKSISEHYSNDNVGKLWFGREVSLVAIFAAIGYNCDFDEMKEIVDNLENNIDLFNLVEYEEARNNIDLSKVNIGNINRKCIYKAFNELIGNSYTSSIGWKIIFEGEVRK